MKTHFAIMAFLTLVVFFPGNGLAATPADPNAKPGSKLIMGPSGTNEDPGAPTSTRRKVTATNGPSGSKFGTWLRRHWLWAGTASAGY